MLLHTHEVLTPQPGVPRPCCGWKGIGPALRPPPRTGEEGQSPPCPHSGSSLPVSCLPPSPICAFTAPRRVPAGPFFRTRYSRDYF